MSLLPGGEADPDSDQPIAPERKKPILEKVTLSPQLQNSILAVVSADIKDKPKHIRDASVVGFLYVAEVDEKKRKVRVLSPMSGRMRLQAMVWGAWPGDVGELVA